MTGNKKLIKILGAVVLRFYRFLRFTVACFGNFGSVCKSVF